ncbi:MAG: RNA polymerase sigma factor, partial [Acidimicrobiia bacterium]
MNAVVDVRRTVDAVWRIESGRLIGSLARILRDVGRAEEVAQDTLVAALEQWPERGVPENPAAWMMATGRNKAIDLIRREVSREEKYSAVAVDLDRADDRDDDLLSLVFIACHPVLPQESRVALTLRLLAGLSTEQIARAFLVPSPTIGQRISRAKRTLAEAQTPFELPAAADLPQRLSAVLEVIYLIFNEGYSASSGDIWIRRDLAEEAMRLGRMLTGLLPKEPEVRGLVALMELQASRFGARTGPDGTPVLLADQDRSRWDRTLRNHGLAALDVATRLGRPLGPYTIQAAIAACHARAPRFEDTDW